MRVWLWIVSGVVALSVAGAAAWVRLAPIDAEAWHVDPLAADPPGASGWLVRPQGGDAAGPVFAATPEALLLRLDAVARAAPRTRRIAGRPEEGRMTYLTRSRFWGFPDFTTVTALPVPDGAAPVLLARARFGHSDLGVNRARIEDWIARIE